MGLLRPATGLPNQVLLVAMQTAVEVSRQRPQYYATVARAFYELGSSGAYLVGSGAGPEASIAHALKKHLIGGDPPTLPRASVPATIACITASAPSAGLSLPCHIAPLSSASAFACGSALRFSAHLPLVG